MDTSYYMLLQFATFGSEDFSLPGLVALGLGVGVVVTVLVRPVRALTVPGAVTAWVLGAFAAPVHGRSGVAALLATLILAVSLRMLPGAKRGRVRNLRHVCSSGLPMAIGALLTMCFPGEHYGAAFFVGSLAYLAADASGTEIGERYGGAPRSLVTGRALARGESGGVTLAGLAASMLGGAIPVYVWVLWNSEQMVLVPVEVRIFTSVGFAGSLLDSVLGALVQYRGRDSATNAITELCSVDGQPTERVAGVRWMDNDAVNLISGLMAGALGVAALRMYLGF